MALQSKLVVYAAIGALFAIMGGFVYYASLDNPKLEQVTVELAGIEVTGEDKVAGKLDLEATFMISNPSDKTFTIPLISYDIYAGGSRIAAGQYSTEDIAMPGRAAFYPGSSIPLKSTTTIDRSAVDAAVYEALLAGTQEATAKGIITAESAWSVVEKEFDTSGT